MSAKRRAPSSSTSTATRRSISRIGVTTSETLTVTAATPVVDVKSTEVNFNYKAAEIEALPLQKNYSGLFQLIPGVADNNSFAPAGGGSRQDNKYLIDGVDITNPGFGYLSTEVNGLDIAEFQVKRGAITAEFGRAIGFVTNAVSRSGTNNFHGIGNLELRPKSFGAAENTLNTAGEIVKIDNTISRTFGSGSLGGPLVKDRLFFYGSALWSNTETTDRTNALGAVPDRTVRTDEFFGKVTGQPAPTMLINGGFRYRPSDCEFCGIGNTQAADGRDEHRLECEDRDGHLELVPPEPHHPRSPLHPHGGERHEPAAHGSWIPAHVQPQRSREHGPVHRHDRDRFR